MASTMKGFGYNAKSRRATGLVGVIIFHVLLIYALVSGLAQNVVKAVQQKVEVSIISEPPPPPPPPPPPKIEKVVEKTVPKPQPVQPPKAYVPPIENPHPQPSENVIAATTAAPPPPQPVVAAPEPTAAPHVGPLSVKGNCTAVEKPEYPAKAQADEISGSVNVVFHVGADGKYSGMDDPGFKGIPPSYRASFKKSIITALQSYTCKPDANYQYEFVFNLNSDS